MYTWDQKRGGFKTHFAAANIQDTFEFIVALLKAEGDLLSEDLKASGSHKIDLDEEDYIINVDFHIPERKVKDEVLEKSEESKEN